MYGKTIKYTDYNGEEKVKTFYFNLTRTELTRMNFSEEGGLKEYIKKMVNEEDNKKILAFFEKIVLGAYGEKSPDGEDFLKSDELRERFQRHPAYDQLFIQLLEGGEKAFAEFINNVVPKDVNDNASKVDRNAIIKELRPDPN